MAGKYTIGYWFKPERKKDLTYGRYLYQCSEEVGISQKFLSNIVNNRIPVKHKSVAYALTKYIGANLEIEDVFDVKPL